MIRIEVTDETITVRKVPKNRGNPDPNDCWLFYSQSAYAYMVQPNGQLGPHPEKINIAMQHDQKPWPAGNYSLAPQSLWKNKYGELDLGRLVLRPLEAVARKVG